MRMYKGLIIAGLAIILHFVADAGSAKVDGRTWYYSEVDEGAEINGVTPVDQRLVIPDTVNGLNVVGIGQFAFCGLTEIQSVTISEGVKKIGYQAFAGCTRLELLTLPATLTYVGQYAFSQCYALSSVVVPKYIADGPFSRYFPDSYGGITNAIVLEGATDVRFEDCKKLKSVTLPASLKNMGYRSFKGCSSLESIIVPDGVGEIGYESFSGCMNLQTISIPSSVTNVGSRAFEGCLGLISVKIKEISSWCEVNFSYSEWSSPHYSTPLYYAKKLFLGDEEIYDLEIPDGITNVNGAFSGFTNLVSVSMPLSVTNIPAFAFSDCPNLKSVIIPGGVKTIGYCAFAFSGVEFLSLSPGITRIPDSSFRNCKIKSLVIPSSVEVIESDAFYGCKELKNVVLNHGVKEIGEYAFLGCYELTHVNLPSSLTYVGVGAFEDCYAYEEVVIPQCVTNLREVLDSDGYWRGLTNVVFCEGTTNIFRGVLDSCNNLKVITIPRSVMRIDKGVFDHCQLPLSIRISPGDKDRVVAMLDAAGYDMAQRVEWQEYVPAPIIYPDDGEVFSSSVKVSIKAPLDGSEIHFTTDGSEPNIESPVYTKAIVASERMTIKSLAVCNGVLSEVAKSQIGPGKCAMPIVHCSLSRAFNRPNNRIAITCSTKNATILYTLDGRDPLQFGCMYNEAFTVSDSLRVKVAAIRDDMLDSEVNTATLFREYLHVDAPEIIAERTFSSDTEQVAIFCATEGADIYFTTDGTAPTRDSLIYTGPFVITNTTMINAVGVKEGWVDSEITSAFLEKALTIGEALNLKQGDFSSEGAAPWMVSRLISYDHEASMRSGELEDDRISELHLCVWGPGTLSFWWKSSCEWTASPEVLLFDAGEFFVDGTRRSYIQGFTDWVKVEVSVDGAGTHELVWRYSKDGSDSEGEDCIWLDCVSWTGSPKIEDAVVPSSIVGGNEDLPIRGSWVTSDLVARYGEGKNVAFCERYGYDLSAALLKPTGKKDASGNALFVWQDYVAGTDPTDPNSLFRVSVEMVNGFPVIKWDPNLNENGACRVYTIYGKYELSDAEWHTPTNGLSRFFKVGVSMPEQGGSTEGEDQQSGEEGSSLLHRWSFNGNLLDSVGGSDAVAVGSVTQGAKEYTLEGGMSGSSYIDLGDDLLPTDGSAVTMEMWATMRSLTAGWTRIWQFGDMPHGFEFSSYNTSVYSENYIGMCWNGMSKFSSDDGEWDNYSWTSFKTDKEAYLSVVYAPNGDGSWTVSYRHIDVASGETLGQHSFSTKGSDWSLASVGQSECLLGQALTCWDACAKASYNEVRIWNRVLSEAEQKAHVAAGPDAALAK